MGRESLAAQGIWIPNVADPERTAVVVGVGAAGGQPAVARRTPAGRRMVGRRTVLRSVRRLLRPGAGPTVDPDGNLSAVDVPEAPVPAGVPGAVRGGGRLDFVAAVLPHRHRRPGAPPDHPQED